MATPAATCFCTISLTALVTRDWKLGSERASRWSRPSTIPTRSSGRGRLPVWVVRMPSVLCFIAPSPLSARAIWRAYRARRAERSRHNPRDTIVQRLGDAVHNSAVPRSGEVELRHCLFYGTYGRERRHGPCSIWVWGGATGRRQP